jgi:hypothetical protein
MIFMVFQDAPRFPPFFPVAPETTCVLQYWIFNKRGSRGALEATVMPGDSSAHGIKWRHAAAPRASANAGIRSAQ